MAQAEFPWGELISRCSPLMRSIEPIRQRLYDPRIPRRTIRQWPSSSRVMCRRNWRRRGTRTRRPGCNATSAETGWRRRSSLRGFRRGRLRRSSTGSGATRWWGSTLQTAWHQNPLYRLARVAELARDPTLRRNIARLADYDWSFDLQCSRPDADAGQASHSLSEGNVRACSTPNAGGMSLPDARLARRNGTLAAWPNMSDKLSPGMGTFIHAMDPAHIAGYRIGDGGDFGPIAHVRFEFSIGSCGPDMAISSTLSRHRQDAPAPSRRDLPRYGNARLSSRALALRRGKQTKGKGGKPGVAKSRFLLCRHRNCESSFLVARVCDCGRTRRVMKLVFSLSGAPTRSSRHIGYRSNQIMNSRHARPAVP